jgi:hypothetical protein
MTCCPYCKTPEPRSTAKIICQNCLDYAKARELDAAQRAEIEMFATYWAVPYDWRASDSWRTDSYFLLPSVKVQAVDPK